MGIKFKKGTCSIGEVEVQLLFVLMILKGC